MSLSLAAIKRTFFHILTEIFGISKGAWDVAEPILASGIGNFLAAAVPLAGLLVEESVRTGGFTDDGRDKATEALRQALISQGIQTGVQVTTGLLRYAIDTAYHTAKVAPDPAVATNVILMETPVAKAA